MKLLLIFFFISQSAFAIDVGNGSDGICNITGVGADTQIIATRKNYQCKSLDIDANLDLFNAVHAGAGGSALIIKVQNDVNYTNGMIINLNGDDGLTGALMPGGAKSGGLAGAGGSAGGSSFGTGVDGQNAGNNGGANGSRGGLGGHFVIPDITSTSSYAGGGGGGSFKTQGGTGTDGDDLGTGTVLNSGGVGGQMLGDVTTLDTSFIGGAGGGAGGDGKDNGTFKSGSSGGGGGGAIRIVAGGNITIDGTITANGGKGGGLVATNYSGAGGGGSGGVIFLQAGGNLIILPGSTLEALHGDGGDNSLGPGGVGGDGMIRLDDSDGLVDITGSTVIQGKYTAPFTPTALVTNTSAISRQYASGVSCGSVALDDHEKPYNNFVNIILGFAIAALLHFTVSKKSKV